MAKATQIKVGKQVTIPAGTKVTVNGQAKKRQADSLVTVRNIETTRTGNLKVTWKSHGYKATAILSV